MPNLSSVEKNYTPVAVADTTNFTDAGYHAIQGGSTTQGIRIRDIHVAGLASASAPSQLLLARDSTVGATLSVGTTAAFDPATAALAAPPVTFSTATTKPQRSSTLRMWALGYNAFGGVIRLQLPDNELISILGNTASFGEMSLSHDSSGTPGLQDSTIIIEPL